MIRALIAISIIATAPLLFLGYVVSSSIWWPSFFISFAIVAFMIWRMVRAFRRLLDRYAATTPPVRRPTKSVRTTTKPLTHVRLSESPARSSLDDPYI